MDQYTRTYDRAKKELQEIEEDYECGLVSYSYYQFMKNEALRTQNYAHSNADEIRKKYSDKSTTVTPTPAPTQKPATPIPTPKPANPTPKPATPMPKPEVSIPSPDPQPTKKSEDTSGKTNVNQNQNSGTNQGEINNTISNGGIQNDKSSYSNDLVSHNNEKLTWPCESTSVHDGFGMRIHPITKVEKMHNGVDIGGKSGENAFASLNGKVVTVGYDDGWGNYIKIEGEVNNKRIRVLYAHLLDDSIVVEERQKVNTVDILAKIGKTGAATGPHLHFSLWEYDGDNKRWNYSDPMPYLK